MFKSAAALTDKRCLNPKFFVYEFYCRTVEPHTLVWLLWIYTNVSGEHVKKIRPKYKSLRELSLPIEEISLEVLRGFIDQNLIKNEIPFELVASKYPSLLSEWYPGYPGMPRKMNENDPLLCRGYIKNGQVTFINMFGPPLGPIDLDKDAELEEGEYQIWLKYANGQYSILVVSEI